MKTLTTLLLIAFTTVSVWGQTQSVKINNGSSSNVFYKKIGFLDSRSGEVRISGILGAHTPTQGKSTIDVTFNARDNFIVHGQIDGKSPNSYIVLVKNGEGTFGSHYDIYLRYWNYAQVDFEVTATGNCTTNDGAVSTINPGTVFWSSYDYVGNLTTSSFINGVKVNGDIDALGTIRAEEIIVEAKDNTADFVFANDYTLRDLSEVESFILTNKHLPDIPSAAQMEEQGVNLAEMNKLLLQKVEELTLYAIEKDKEVKGLRSKVQGQNEKLEAQSTKLAKLDVLEAELHAIKDLILNK